MYMIFIFLSVYLLLTFTLLWRHYGVKNENTTDTHQHAYEWMIPHA